MPEVYETEWDGVHWREARVEDHIFKIHLSLDQVPFICNLCLFRCKDAVVLQEYVKKYSRHSLVANENKIQPGQHYKINLVNIIIIYHECEGRIEKSVPRFAFWYHEAWRVMTNGDPEGQIFLSYPHTNYGFFFLLDTFF